VVILSLLSCNDLQGYGGVITGLASPISIKWDRIEAFHIQFLPFEKEKKIFLMKILLVD